MVDDGEESDSSLTGDLQGIDTAKLIRDITREVKKAFREEMESLEKSLEFLSAQILTIEQSVKNQDTNIKNLEHKNQDLSNKNINLELRVSVLEQEIQNIEQKALSSSIEIAGLPNISPQNIKPVLNNLALQLDVSDKDIKSFERLPGTKEKPGVIIIEMKEKEQRIKWLKAGKEKGLRVEQLLPDTIKDKGSKKIFIREALTKTSKKILFLTKTKLKDKFQFIWCKDGKVFARKTNNSKIYLIRSVQDIEKLEKINAEENGNLSFK
ncbi:unnamed protein product [Euphydryas editha]|uniref:Uncharacterized protein n=1 Tax=Euphydryas editha TaxID=104508 RepID=A0AAU9USF8_EUPED|nr:unnamed protein product [Euphydryas editha]